MFKKLPYYLVLMIAMFAINAANGQGLPDKTYEAPCLEDVDMIRATVLDLDQDNHYETMETWWCDWDTGNDFPIMSPIIYPPEASKGMPINDVADDDLPFKRLKKPKPGKKPNFKLEFFIPMDGTVIYDYEMFDDSPEVFYTQYIPYTDVEEPDNMNGIEITPNPAVNNVVMSSDMFTSNNIMIRIYNQNGQDVSPMIEIGQEVSFDVSHLSSGVYFVHTIIGTDRYVNTLFVVR